MKYKTSKINLIIIIIDQNIASNKKAIEEPKSQRAKGGVDLLTLHIFFQNCKNVDNLHLFLCVYHTKTCALTSSDVNLFPLGIHFTFLRNIIENHKYCFNVAMHVWHQ